MGRLIGTSLVMGFFLAARAHAQAPLSEKPVLIAGEDVQIRNRLVALDRQMAFPASAVDLAKWVSWSAPATPLQPLVAKLLENGASEKWEQLLDEYQKLMDDSFDVLVSLGPADPRTGPPPPSVQGRQLVHRRIASLPPPVLKLYRQRVEGRTQKLLEEGRRRIRRPLASVGGGVLL